jgi:hypothetical protein
VARGGARIIDDVTFWIGILFIIATLDWKEEGEEKRDWEEVLSIFCAWPYTDTMYKL